MIDQEAANECVKSNAITFVNSNPVMGINAAHHIELCTALSEPGAEFFYCEIYDAATRAKTPGMHYYTYSMHKVVSFTTTPELRIDSQLLWTSLGESTHSSGRCCVDAKPGVPCQCPNAQYNASIKPGQPTLFRYVTFQNRPSAREFATGVTVSDEQRPPQWRRFEPDGQKLTAPESCSGSITLNLAGFTPGVMNTMKFGNSSI